jgi:hypothetical protein
MTYTLEDYLVGLHEGQWFGWSDNNNKVYANLVIHSDDAKPSESACTAGVATLQSDYDALEYSRLRKAKYDLLNQDEMRYDDVKNSTTTWVDAIDAIKAAHPKP